MCCKRLRLLLAPAFYWLFAKTYCFLPMQVPQKPKLILVQVQDSMLYVFYCKVLVKHTLRDVCLIYKFIELVLNQKQFQYNRC